MERLGKRKENGRDRKGVKENETLGKKDNVRRNRSLESRKGRVGTGQKRRETTRKDWEGKATERIWKGYEKRKERERERKGLKENKIESTLERETNGKNVEKRMGEGVRKRSGIRSRKNESL